MCVWVCACVCACVRACVRACVCDHELRTPKYVLTKTSFHPNNSLLFFTYILHTVCGYGRTTLKPKLDNTLAINMWLT